MPRAIQRVAGGLLRISEDGVIKLFGFNARALDCLFGSNRAEFLRSEVLQLAAVSPEWRACAADDRNVTWLEHGSSEDQSVYAVGSGLGQSRTKAFNRRGRRDFAEDAEKT